MTAPWPSEAASRRLRCRRIAPLAVLLVLAPGCSWLFVQRPPDLPIGPDAPFECTQEVTLPALDIAGSAASGVLGILLVAAALSSPVASNCPPNSSDCITPTDRNEMVIAGASMVALGGAVAFSAAYGLSETSRCREINGWKAGCLSGLEDDCWKLYRPRTTGPLPPPPPLPMGPPGSTGREGPAASPPGTPQPAPAPPPSTSAPTPPSVAVPPGAPAPAPLPAPTSPPPPKSPFGPPTRPRRRITPSRARGSGRDPRRDGGARAGGRARSR
jgi:hypothetical protein